MQPICSGVQMKASGGTECVHVSPLVVLVLVVKEV